MFPKIRKYPKTILVNGNIWEVKFSNKIELRGEIVDGLSCPDIRTIYIRFGQDRRETFKTFIHEWLHAIEAEYEIDIPHKLIGSLEDPIADSWEENAESIFEMFFLCFGKG